MANIIVTELTKSVVQIQLNDINGKNRLDEDLVSDFVAHLNSLGDNPNTKVIILSGQPDVFCGGGSLNFLYKLTTGETNERDWTAAHQLLLQFPLPVIAAMEGHAVGGGLMLAICCDIIVAAEEKRYGFNFTSLGFTPGVGTTALIPALVGYHFAFEMMLTAKFYRGKELKNKNLFNYVVPSKQVMPTAMDIAYQLAEKPRYVLQMLKETLSLPRCRAFGEAKSREHLMHQICFNQPETTQLIKETYLK